jgi:hypothetical protein
MKERMYYKCGAFPIILRANFGRMPRAELNRNNVPQTPVIVYTIRCQPHSIIVRTVIETRMVIMIFVFHQAKGLIQRAFTTVHTIQFQAAGVSKFENTAAFTVSNSLITVALFVSDLGTISQGYGSAQTKKPALYALSLLTSGSIFFPDAS